VSDENEPDYWWTPEDKVYVELRDFLHFMDGTAEKALPMLLKSSATTGANPQAHSLICSILRRK
jgi:hypothetical protein